jgi:hypothetical protein
MVWLLLLLAAFSWAASPDQVVARVAAVEPYRQMRHERNAPRPDEASIRKAAQGTIVSGLSGNTGWGVAVVNVPIGQLWAGLNDETRHPGYTATGFSVILQGRACASGRLVFQFLPVPMVADRWWVSTLRHHSAMSRDSGGAVRELYFRGTVDPSLVTSPAARKLMVDAEPIGSTRGGWFLVAIDAYTTYVEYHSNTDPGAGVPTSLAQRLAAKGVRDTIAAMERFAKEGRPVCPVY